MTKNKLLATTLLTLSLAACGGTPVYSETTETSSTRETDAGGEVTHSATTTREVDDDGASTAHTESTTTSTPPTP